MPLEVSLLSEAEITDFVEAEAAAMKSYAYAQALAVNLPKGVSRLDDVRATFKQNEETVWLKVTEEGKLIAGAIWLYQFGTKEMPRAVDGPAIPPPAFEAERLRRGREYNEKFRMGPHANLAALFTHPDFQGRGAGSMLLRWGCAKADEHKLISTLHASPAGIKVYQKHGFEIVEQYKLDLRPFGVDETTVRTGMVRWAK